MTSSEVVHQRKFAGVESNMDKQTVSIIGEKCRDLKPLENLGGCPFCSSPSSPLPLFNVWANVELIGEARPGLRVQVPV